MATRVIGGQRNWSMARDDRGFREYKIVFGVEGSTFDGPANVIQTPGLPVVGSFWNFDADVDIYAWCRPNATVTPRVTNEPNNFWDVEFTFSNKPLEGGPGNGPNPYRCQDQQFENPLFEPQRVSGSFSRFQEEATYDRFGFPLITSSFEQIRGPQVEFDRNRAIVKVEQNVPYLGVEIWSPMVDTLNAIPLWGLPPRRIKLSNVTWERKLYGRCLFYYTRTFEFEITPDTFDRIVLDEGSKALSGRWDPISGQWTLVNIGGVTPNYLNPAHYVKFTDRNGNIARVILNGQGRPYDPGNTIAQWYCVTDRQGMTFCLNATCAGMRERLRELNTAEGSSHNFRAYGPYADQAACTAACTLQTILAGGQPTPQPCTTAVGFRYIQKYGESNFLLLGIPLTF